MICIYFYILNYCLKSKSISQNVYTKFSLEVLTTTFSSFGFISLLLQDFHRYFFFGNWLLFDASLDHFNKITKLFLIYVQNIKGTSGCSNLRQPTGFYTFGCVLLTTPYSFNKSVSCYILKHFLKWNFSALMFSHFHSHHL